LKLLSPDAAYQPQNATKYSSPDLLVELTVLLKPKDLRDKWEEGLVGGNSGPLASNPGYNTNNNNKW